MREDGQTLVDVIKKSYVQVQLHVGTASKAYLDKKSYF